MDDTSSIAHVGPFPGWTDDIIQQLRAFVEAGMSSGKIAQELGATRNTVIGKCKRLGLQLTGREQLPRPPRASKPKRPHEEIRDEKRRHMQWLRNGRQALPQPAPQTQHARNVETARRVDSYIPDIAPVIAQPIADFVGEFLEGATAPEGTQVYLLAAEHWQCRWIQGDTTDAICCGEKVKLGSSFCPSHHARCFYKAREPERKAMRGRAA